MPPLTSVVIPCFRQGHLLREAVDSALAQSYPAVEVVVVNDGSDDDTDAVARSYGDRIMYVSQKNCGLPGARNAGIRASEGSYLMFLDADDRLHPRAVEVLLDSASEDRLVVGWFETFSDDPRLNITSGGGLSIGSLMADLSMEAALLIGNFAVPCAFLCPRRAVEKVGLFDTAPETYGCEDWDLWMKLVLDGLEIHVVPEVVAYYRQHYASMTRSSGVRMGEAIIRLHQRNLTELAGRAARIAVRSVGRVELARRIRQRMKKELLDTAFLHRTNGAYLAASRSCLRAAWWCGLGRQELVEVMKILAAACTLRRRDARAVS